MISLATCTPNSKPLRLAQCRALLMAIHLTMHQTSPLSPSSTFLQAPHSTTSFAVQLTNITGCMWAGGAGRSGRWRWRGGGGGRCGRSGGGRGRSGRGVRGGRGKGRGGRRGRGAVAPTRLLFTVIASELSRCLLTRRWGWAQP